MGGIKIDHSKPVFFDDHMIHVEMFGGLSIRIGETVIKDLSTKSFQLWNLLEYLIAFRHKPIAPEELYAALWGDDKVENPASALKNLVYRVRSLLSVYDIPFAKSIITYSGGSYCWNNSIPCTVDIEEFETLQKRAGNTSQPLEYRIESYTRALELYKGDFLETSNHKSWIAPVRGYYKSIYFKCVNRLLRLLSDQERYKEMEAVCEKSLAVDRFDETSHRYMILSLTRQGEQERAMAHYKSVSDLFLRQLGVQPSASLRNLYRQIVKTATSSEIDIGIIRQDLRETEAAEGAFYCEYEVFKSVYQLLSRTAPRVGQNVYIALFTITGSPDGHKDSENRKHAMDCLFHVIQTGTRRGDVLARFSASQYILLLTTADTEGCDIALSRIKSAYAQNADALDNALHVSIQPLDS